MYPFIGLDSSNFVTIIDVKYNVHLIESLFIWICRSSFVICYKSNWSFKGDRSSNLRIYL